jgi:hypothetical protein
MTSTESTKKEKERIVASLNEFGFAISHVEWLLTKKEKLMFQEVKKLFEEMLSNPKIQKRMELLKNNTPMMDRNKFFEITIFEHYQRALNLGDFDVIKFSLSESLLDIAEAYLGSEVKVRNILTWIHPENPNRASHSMRWHRDTESQKHIKVFSYFNYINKNNGALSYVKNSAKGEKNDHIWHNLNDEKLNGTGYLNSAAVAKIPREDIIQAEGISGTIVFLNTNGFHKGGFVKEGYRAMSHFLYARSTSCQLTNGQLTDFNYNSQINYCDFESQEFKNLNSRQQQCLLPAKQTRNGG